jgi:N-acetylglucosaminyldiphosphoundecaprenol N-acetyl-beta-D-mannosaminyltransferase
LAGAAAGVASAYAGLFPESARQLDVLGVKITDLAWADALVLAESLLASGMTRPRTLYFANAHTLNLAFESDAYRAVLNRADYVFGDGTGVRWGARLQGVRLRANLNGTDLVPDLLAATSGRGFRWYLLGASAKAVHRAAEKAREMFPGWEVAGYHHGYFDARSEPHVIADINRADPHLLLVAMGNPIQEHWIDRNRGRLQARLCMGVGALADRWAGDLIRAPLWVRQLGMEWIDILRRQPQKWQRYLIGNPKYLYRLLQHHPGHQQPAESLRPDAVPEAVLAGESSQSAQTAS